MKGNGEYVLRLQRFLENKCVNFRSHCRNSSDILSQLSVRCSDITSFASHWEHVSALKDTKADILLPTCIWIQGLTLYFDILNLHDQWPGITQNLQNQSALCLIKINMTTKMMCKKSIARNHYKLVKDWHQQRVDFWRNEPCNN